MNKDFGLLIRENPHGFRTLGIKAAYLGHLALRFTVDVVVSGDNWIRAKYTIDCQNAVDYSIRPVNAAVIEGGPLVEYHEEHTLLNGPGLQCTPGGDGEVFDPPLVLRVLILGDSYVIAERFSIIGIEQRG